jgi:DNA helicase-2/ATP-dependent DNA helicase PcrA
MPKPPDCKQKAGAGGFKSARRESPWRAVLAPALEAALRWRRLRSRGLGANGVGRMPWNEIVGNALEIAGYEGRRQWVASGPCTGKSTALKHLLWRLIDASGVDPTKILLCTFTRTAADDLRRDASSLGIERIDEVNVRTIHSYCFSILADEAVLRQSGRTPRTMLEFEKRFLARDLRESNGWKLAETTEAIHAWSAAWSRLEPDEPGWPHQPRDQQFLREITRWLKFHKAMLLEELVPLARDYLRANPLSPYRGAFRAVLVDEYQDLNRAEQDVVELLLADDGTITVVGDEDQSIYVFRFANPEGMRSYPIRYPDARRMPLETCRRCPPRVVAVANSVIANNRNRQPRALAPDTNPGRPQGEICVVQWADLAAEVAGLATYVAAKVRRAEVGAGDVLILAPRRTIGRELRDAFVQRGIEARTFFHEELLDGVPEDDEKNYLQRAYTLLQLLAEPTDTVALRAWCGFGSPQLRAGAWRRVWDKASDLGISVRNVLEALAEGSLEVPHTTQVVTAFRELIERETALRPLQGRALVDGLFPATEVWASELRSMLSDPATEDATAQSLASAIKTLATQPELPAQVTYVRVMSLHKSKGLAAKLVIVAGCTQGLIPKETEPAEKLEEQRRLFYVAVTRARQSLVLSHAMTAPWADAQRLNAVGASTYRHNDAVFTRFRASDFIAELGPHAPRAERGADFLARQAGAASPQQ